MPSNTVISSRTLRELKHDSKENFGKYFWPECVPCIIANIFSDGESSDEVGMVTLINDLENHSMKTAASQGPFMVIQNAISGPYYWWAEWSGNKGDKAVCACLVMYVCSEIDCAERNPLMTFEKYWSSNLGSSETGVLSLRDKCHAWWQKSTDLSTNHIIYMSMHTVPNFLHRHILNSCWAFNPCRKPFFGSWWSKPCCICTSCCL